MIERLLNWLTPGITWEDLIVLLPAEGETTSMNGTLCRKFIAHDKSICFVHYLSSRSVMIEKRDPLGRFPQPKVFKVRSPWGLKKILIREGVIGKGRTKRESYPDQGEEKRKRINLEDKKSNIA